MFIILEIKIQVLCIKTQITFGTLNKQLHLCCQFHSHPCCSCCAAVDCSFCLLSTLGFLWRANICSLRVIKTVVCGALSSLLFSLTSCFEPVYRLFQDRICYFRYLGKWKTCCYSSRLANKSSLLLSEKALSKQRAAVSVILLLRLPLLLWHRLRVSPNFYNSNPESSQNTQTSHGHAFKLWKMFFYTALLRFQHLLSPKPSNVGLVFGLLILNYSILCKWC